MKALVLSGDETKKHFGPISQIGYYIGKMVEFEEEKVRSRETGNYEKAFRLVERDPETRVRYVFAAKDLSFGRILNK